MNFSLPALPYAYEDLSPYMSRKTLEYHHDKHHKAYVDNLNTLLPQSTLDGETLTEIVKKSQGKFPALFNNAGQHYNHLHFWKWMKKDGGGKDMPSEIQKGIDRDLGGYEQFRSKFINAGMIQFGSGWCWLAIKDGKFIIINTANGENPLLHEAKPILGCDVWEHAYYIDYQNNRADYLAAFIDHLVNWEYVEKMYGESKAKF